MSASDALVALLIQHEGEKLHPYRCTAGKLTIGVGRNLDDKGISIKESRFLLQNDLEDAERDARTFCVEFGYLLPARQAVLIDMAFNLGLGGLLNFKKFQKALDRKDFDAASKEMLDSAWAKQVGQRAQTLSTMMRTGSFK